MVGSTGLEIIADQITPSDFRDFFFFRIARESELQVFLINWKFLEANKTKMILIIDPASIFIPRQGKGTSNILVINEIKGLEGIIRTLIISEFLIASTHGVCRRP